MIDLVGWIATAVFVSSYFCTRADALRRLQMLGASIWLCYGLLMHALPVIAANALVLAAAAWTARRRERSLQSRRVVASPAESDAA